MAGSERHGNGRRGCHDSAGELSCVTGSDAKPSSCRASLLNHDGTDLNPREAAHLRWPAEVISAYKYVPSSSACNQNQQCRTTNCTGQPASLTQDSSQILSRFLTRPPSSLFLFLLISHTDISHINMKFLHILSFASLAVAIPAHTGESFALSDESVLEKRGTIGTLFTSSLGNLINVTSADLASISTGYSCPPQLFPRHYSDFML